MIQTKTFRNKDISTKDKDVNKFLLNSNIIYRDMIITAISKPHSALMNSNLLTSDTEIITTIIFEKVGEK